MFCPHCGKPNKEGGKFCVHCGKPLISTKGVMDKSNQGSQSTPTAVTQKVIDPKKIEKWEKSIKNAGSTTSAFGWIELVVYAALLIWYLIDKSFSQSGLAISVSGFVETAYVALVYIILGNRIKTLKDINTKRYIYILFYLSIVLLLYAVVNKAGLGIIFLLVLIGITSARNNIGRLMKQEDFRSRLTAQKYRVTLPWWIAISLIAIIAFSLGAVYDYRFRTPASNTTQTGNTITQAVWINYTSDKADFTASLPVQPKRTTDSTPITNTSITAETNGYDSTLADGESYVINVTKYVGATSVDAQKVLEGALNGMVSSNAGNKLVSSGNTKVGNNSAMDYLIQNGTTYLKGRLVVRDAILYQLMYQYEGTQYNESNYNEFISKFTLI